jgi:hypothetical protein
VFLAAAFAPLGAEAAGADDAWYRVGGPHFELLGQAPAAELEQFAAELEHLHALLETLGADPQRFRPPLTIFALDREGLGAFGPEGAGLGPRDNRITGYFVPGALGDAIVFERDPASEPRATLFHEYLHAFVRHHLPAAPLWLNEGLAEYYSTFELARDRSGSPGGVLGLPKERHLVTLERERMLSLDRLLDVEVDSPLYHEADRRGVFYAQSWAFVHFLLSDAGRRARTSRYLALLERHGDSERAFGEAFEESYLALELELGRYLEHQPLPRSYVELPGAAAPRSGARPARDADVQAALGELMLAQRRGGEARERFERALAADRRHTRALAGMGRVHLERGDVALALEWLETAASAPGARDTWLPSLLLGEALLRSVREALPGSGERTPAEAGAARQRFAAELAGLERARVALRSALEQDARLAPAHAAIGRAWLLEGSVAGALDPAAAEEAITALRRAIELQPERLEPTVDLAVVLCRVDRCADARRVVEELLPLYAVRDRRSSAELLPQAREQVARVELDRAARLASAMRPEEALERIDALLAALDGETLSALGPEIDEVVAVASHNAHVAAYNRALDLARAGRNEEAARALAPVLRDARDRELLASARQLDALLRRSGR